MRVRHAFTGLIYELGEDGNVRISDPATGMEGLYTPTAVHVSGDVLAVDHHLCGHVGGRTAMPAGMFGGMGDAAPTGDG
jgi:hypothetical protein